MDAYITARVFAEQPSLRRGHVIYTPFSSKCISAHEAMALQNSE